MKTFIFLFLLMLSNCFADNIEALVISDAGAKAKANGSDGIPYKLGQWNYNSFSSSTTNAIYNALIQVGESGNISDVTGIRFVKTAYVEDLTPTNAFQINPTTFADTTATIEIPDRLNGYSVFSMTVRKAGVNTTYNTATFPNVLKKNIYKMWLKFENGNP